MTRIKNFYLTGLVVPILLAGCHPDTHDHEVAATGQELFKEHCSGCHQQDGQGLFLKGYPAIKSTQMDTWQITHKIRGKETEGRNMPSFPDMTEAEATKIANYVKSLNIQ